MAQHFTGGYTHQLALSVFHLVMQATQHTLLRARMVVLSDYAEFLYKTTDYYTPSAERCIRWDDPDLNINWQLTGTPTLSAKDQNGKSLKEADLFP